ncbi:MAG: BolA/IbaG family iron-sulfur metabolism protein [Pseudomonadota bacterium]
MPVPASEIERLILESLPGALVEVVDTAGDQNHYAVNVVAEEFRGMNRVQQQRMVNKALESILHGHGAPLHAMALQTSAPE